MTMTMTNDDVDSDSALATADMESVAGSVRRGYSHTGGRPAEVAVPRAPALRHAFTNMDEVVVERIFSLRASVMRSVPRFLHGPFRNAMKMVLEEIMASVEDVRVTRGRKVFLLLPRLLLHRPPGGGVISREKLVTQFEAFTRGDWRWLLEASRICDEQAAL